MSFSPAPSSGARVFPRTLAGILLAPMALGGCVVRVDSHDVRTREEKRFHVDGAPDISLTTFDGAIDVRGWDRDEVFVEIEKRGREKAAVDQIEVFAEQKGNRILLEARQPAGGKYALGMLTTMSRSARLIASVPSGSNVTLHSGDGAISIERVKGRVELRTNDGAISGLDLSGDLLARTDDGNVRLNSVDGRCDVVTGDGSITLDGRFDVIRARTDDGSITLKVLPGSKVSETWSLTTGDGNAIVYLPDGLNADLDAESGDGRTRIEDALNLRVDGAVARRMLRGTLGNGGPMVRVRTTDGQISFRRLPYKLRTPELERVEKIERDRLERDRLEHDRPERDRQER